MVSNIGVILGDFHLAYMWTRALTACPVELLGEVNKRMHSLVLAQTHCRRWRSSRALGVKSLGTVSERCGELAWPFPQTLTEVKNPYSRAMSVSRIISHLRTRWSCPSPRLRGDRKCGGVDLLPYPWKSRISRSSQPWVRQPDQSYHPLESYPTPNREEGASFSPEHKHR